MFHQSLPYRIYMSGDAYGSFPNDGVQLISTEKDGKIRKFPRMNDEMFIVDEKLIQANKLKTVSGQIITFDRFIEDHLLVSIKNIIDRI